MLLALSLRDFVIVENLNLDFQNGFTVLTGETGAGKSITLDALGLLLGDKADYSQVRNGAKEAQFSALFDIGSLPQLQAQLREQGLLEDEAEELNIRRIIDAKGKSRSYINNQAATLAQLKTIGEQLIDIHGQNAHHSLNQESAQRQLLDAFAGALEQAESVRQQYQSWVAAKKSLQEAQEQSENIAIERERLEWQFNELTQLNLQAGEWETLSQSHDNLAHSAELLQTAEQIGENIDGDNGIQRQIYQCQKLLGNLQNIEPRFAESLNMLASIEAELGEISANMRDVAGRTDIDPDELAEQERRMAELMSMARKYRIEPEALPDKLAEIASQLESLHAAADLEALEAAVAQQFAEYQEAAHTLSAMRHQAAGRLSSETTEHMQHLAMKGARFDIVLLPSSPTAHGLEQVQFQVAANKGSVSRPLNKVASGGELARISLAIQVVSSQYTHVPTLIFDEVDTGIGGGVAEMVGKALRALGKQHQVLAVTHLPQVASCGEHHWQVRKHSEGEQTVSEIRVLNEQERVEEVARMLGGEIITDTTRHHAAELLTLAAA
ncbi:DNA repair protein RecN [Neisseria sp. N95_16]|uniref:DNA repair protein RecN n=1 Tax=Neisseria brasiliensis TaxID=2666100 RepID=A0A5Q3S203_9NEIS|nr:MULTISPECIES: DNA repair protein RecN [Neisseria]MRN37072.1 DNA repair protein RecN [Neisseria brasiliensis]PJO08894.1 DNA repair protein RecN [Neisseria sp. N95_16]PJO77578.1 DNA repair protein RecN [Neisseria sp. N177_16]QGL25955.1 DNA repair protein RecN [Neisseria brasiliensis]